MAAPDIDATTPVSPRSEAEWNGYFDLRWRVLRAPWQQPRGSEKDDRELESDHLMIVGKDSRPLAIGRLHLNSPTEAQIRFMAVDPAAQGCGLGGAILQGLEQRARLAGALLPVREVLAQAGAQLRAAGRVRVDLQEAEDRRDAPEQA